MNLEYFTNQFEQIKKLDEPFRTTKLAHLMSHLEQVFAIPMLNNEAYNERNKDVMSLYKQVSNARQL